ncbi:MAG TPA: nucleoside triphosphate pyrophosphohydrolase [Gammaproteobacteria bacterium]|jgi:MazG family protein|nr:nucleoside triphosphate pyrophosphohydrolase [Gammaproteobacteria bacterium]
MTSQSDRKSIENLLEIMATLRDPARGCPWDREQTFATIAPYTIEEAYEVADAIERQATDELRSELGDLLFQVVFLSRLAQEAGLFDFDAVAADIAGKLIRRHPHVFGGAEVRDSAEQTRLWEDIKRQERAAAGASGLLDDVPANLPGLSRAVKLGRRAASVGFDWPDVGGVRAKVAEELAEVDAAVAGGEAAEIAAEMGDLLFSIANWCRHLGLDPDACARGANERFARRFRAVEAAVAASGRGWDGHDAAALDVLWRRAKAGEA